MKRNSVKETIRNWGFLDGHIDCDRLETEEERNGEESSQDHDICKKKRKRQECIVVPRVLKIVIILVTDY